MTLVLDAGAFVAVERGNRKVAALIKSDRLAGREPITHGGVVGQVWRGGTGRQALTRVIKAGTHPGDLRVLAAESGTHLELVPVS